MVRLPLPPEQTVQSNRCGNQKKGKSEKKKKRAKASAKETSNIERRNKLDNLD
jgi:hypothetical protein